MLALHVSVDLASECCRAFFFKYGFPKSPLPRRMLRQDNLVWQGRKFDRKVRCLTGDYVVSWWVGGRDVMGMNGVVLQASRASASSSCLP